MEAANLPTFLQFGNAKKSDICVTTVKKLWVAMKLGGGWSKSGGCCAPLRPRPKTATEHRHTLYHINGINFTINFTQQLLLLRYISTSFAYLGGD